MNEINEHMKWPGNKEQYDRNYIRCFGVECPQCMGSGVFAGEECRTCEGLGKVERKR
jgi:DnaJ-class molecular chaperone